jgi:hypothetical protein
LQRPPRRAPRVGDGGNIFLGLGAGRKFLERIALAPADKAKLSHGTADALLKLKVK